MEKLVFIINWNEKMKKKMKGGAWCAAALWMLCHTLPAAADPQDAVYVDPGLPSSISSTGQVDRELRGWWAHTGEVEPSTAYGTGDLMVVDRASGHLHPFACIPRMGNGISCRVAEWGDHLIVRFIPAPGLMFAAVPAGGQGLFRIMLEPGTGPISVIAGKDTTWGHLQIETADLGRQEYSNQTEIQVGDEEGNWSSHVGFPPETPTCDLRLDPTVDLGVIHGRDAEGTWTPVPTATVACSGYASLSLRAQSSSATSADAGRIFTSSDAAATGVAIKVSGHEVKEDAAIQLGNNSVPVDLHMEAALVNVPGKTAVPGDVAVPVVFHLEYN